MATGSAAPNYHGQLAINTVDVITMDRAWDVIQVVNVDGAARIDYTIDGSTPVVGGSPAGRVIPATVAVDQVDTENKGNVVVRLISAGTPHYSIIGGI